MSEIVKPSNNLFSHCPKELVLDGFLAWLFNYLNESKNENTKLHLLNSLFSVDGKKFQDASRITTKRQHEHSDLLVEFFSPDMQKVLFENKTWSSPHGNQLENYRKEIPGCLKYIYLKLAFVPYGERKEVERWDEKRKHGYVVVTGSQLLDAIAPLRGEHPFIEEYCAYLLSQFVTPQKQLEAELFKHNNFEKLKEAEAQQYILSELHEKLDQRHPQKQDLKFKAKFNNDGRPFTTLRIALNKDVSPGVAEYIYWRIDKRSNRFYIRLTQYAKVDDAEALKQKKLRLNQFQNDCINIVSELNLDWTPEKQTNGKYESEIAIYFFDDDKNSLSKIREGLEKYSLAFIKKYSEFNQHS